MGNASVHSQSIVGSGLLNDHNAEPKNKPVNSEGNAKSDAGTSSSHSEPRSIAVTVLIDAV